ncbi:biotin synthase BioB [Endozoicomonas arenosclerae]|uniref:biotin synthase BioB n=1 Tax=Endozoicomonas arenosclerae TaxID=1633495 RepID=UPI000781B389
MSKVVRQEELIRTDWTLDEVREIYHQPFNDLLFQAHSIHRQFFDPNHVQLSTLLSIKTGACPEDCKYCPQSGRFNTGLQKEKLMRIEAVLDKAKQAKESGATRFCMGAAWRNPNDRDLGEVIEMIKGVKALGMESCVTLGMLTDEQANALAEAGLDYYNHNIDTSPEFYGDIITTRTFSDRLDTLDSVQKAGINVCSGGIVGMGETSVDRASFLHQLAILPVHPGSVPINLLVKVKGTPLDSVEDLDPLEYVRTVAAARILMPKAHVRISAGRMQMSDELHALAYFAGANSIFLGETLLTTPLPEEEADYQLFNRLGIQPEPVEVHPEDSGDTALFYNAAG